MIVHLNNSFQLRRVQVKVEVGVLNKYIQYFTAYCITATKGGGGGSVLVNRFLWLRIWNGILLIIIYFLFPH